MMTTREIKFRAWSTISDGFIEPIIINGLTGRLVDSNAILSQFTGLKDKHGKEIYEGDIIDDCGVTWYVEFGNGQYVLRCTCHHPDGDFYVFEASPTYEVIGNIYEHPELLK